MTRYWTASSTYNVDTTKDFVAQGGEGSIFRVSRTHGIKIYHDPQRVVPIPKIRELAAIRDPRVILPEEPLFGDSQKSCYVGHTFRFVDSSTPLSPLFTKGFRRREAITNPMIHDLILKCREVIERIHKAQTLIVDLNEGNILVGPDFVSPWFIDTDSYQTPNFPARAIAEVIMDPIAHGKWTEGSDWFSFAVLVCKLLIGIHPYQGQHPCGKDLLTRMQLGISIFDPATKLPPACFPMSDVPSAYMDWMKAIFVSGKRLEPPASMSGAPILLQPILIHATNLREVAVLTTSEEIRKILYADSPQRHVVLGQNKLWIDGGKSRPAPQGPCAVLDVQGRILLSLDAEGNLTGEDLDGSRQVTTQIAAQSLMSADGRIFARMGESITEIRGTCLNNRVFLTAHSFSTVMPQATRMDPGVITQNAFGSPLFMVFPSKDTSVRAIVRELEHHTVLGALSSKGVLLVSTRKGTRYFRHVLRFDSSGAYDLRTEETPVPYEPSMAVLDTGVCAVSVPHEEKLEIFLNHRGHPATKIVTDPLIASRAADLFACGAALWAVSDTHVFLWKTS